MWSLARVRETTKRACVRAKKRALVRATLGPKVLVRKKAFLVP